MGLLHKRILFKRYTIDVDAPLLNDHFVRMNVIYSFVCQFKIVQYVINVHILVLFVYVCTNVCVRV